MRLVGTSEWVVIGVLIAYLAFTPGFPVVRQFLSSGVGKAVGLAVIVAVWKYVSHPVALLLIVNFVRCSGMREYLEDGAGATSGTTLPENTHCPENYSFDNGQCKNKTTSQTIPATVCLAGQTWDGAKCAGSSAAAAPPAASAPPPPSTSSTEMKQPFSNMTPASYGGVQPSMPEKENFAPA